MSIEFSVRGGDPPADRARSLCHDLRQPLAAIMLLCAGPAGEGDERLEARLRDIQSQAAVLAEMIDAELEPGWVDDPTAAECEAEAVVSSVAASARITYRGELRHVAGPPTARVALNATVLRRVLANVVDNATRAAGAHGQVRIRTRVVRSRLVLDVEDDGPGWGRIRSGHGLGLAYVHQAVSGAGGAVSTGRTSRGWTQVRIMLPVVGLAT